MAGWHYEDWDDGEQALFDDLFRDHPGAYTDDDAQWFFHEALFDPDNYGDREARQETYNDMLDYFNDEYLLDFEQDFDWEAFREWYDAA
jgi:hypothetical protein